MLRILKLDALILITAVTFTVIGVAQVSATTDTNAVPYSIDNSGIPIAAGINRTGYYLRIR